MGFIFIIIKLILYLGIVLSLMYLSFRVAGNSLNKINKNKNIKVLEKVQISKDNYLVIIKICEQGWVFSVSSTKSEKLLKLSDEELKNVESKIVDSAKNVEQYHENILNKLSKYKNNIIRINSKEEIDEM